MKLNDTIFLEEIPFIPPIEKSSVKGYIKHVSCEGARFHVIRYTDKGMYCSEPNCIMNAKKK